MNIEAFKNLIEKYESISLVNIKEGWDEFSSEESAAYYTLQNLTGFGSCNTCSLCEAVGTTIGGRDWKTTCNCQNCMYYLVNPNGECPPCVDDTYEAIDSAGSPEELYDAIQNRIKYMKQIVEIYEASN